MSDPRSSVTSTRTRTFRLPVPISLLLFFIVNTIYFYLLPVYFQSAQTPPVVDIKCEIAEAVLVKGYICIYIRLRNRNNTIIIIHYYIMAVMEFNI